eukprot:1158977-Pelagomonas_calceolata.AAC.3
MNGEAHDVLLSTKACLMLQTQEPELHSVEHRGGVEPVLGGMDCCALWGKARAPRRAPDNLLQLCCQVKSPSPQSSLLFMVSSLIHDLNPPAGHLLVDHHVQQLHDHRAAAAHSAAAAGACRAPAGDLSALHEFMLVCLVIDCESCISQLALWGSTRSMQSACRLFQKVHDLRPALTSKASLFHDWHCIGVHAAHDLGLAVFFKTGFVFQSMHPQTVSHSACVQGLLCAPLFKTS